MKARILLVLALCFAVISTAAAEGFYAGAGLGVVQIEDEDQGVRFKDSPMGWRLIAGFDVNDNFAVEGNYINSGTAEDTIEGEKVEAELSAFVVSLVGLMPVSDTTKLFGKLGYYSGEEEVSAFGITIDEDADGFTAGAGIRFDLKNNVSIRGDFDWYDSDLDSLWSIGVGLQFSFGN